MKRIKLAIGALAIFGAVLLNTLYAREGYGLVKKGLMGQALADEVESTCGTEEGVEYDCNYRYVNTVAVYNCEVVTRSYYLKDNFNEILVYSVSKPYGVAHNPDIDVPIYLHFKWNSFIDKSTYVPMLETYDHCYDGGDDACTESNQPPECAELLYSKYFTSNIP